MKYNKNRKIVIAINKNYISNSLRVVITGAFTLHVITEKKIGQTYTRVFPKSKNHNTFKLDTNTDLYCLFALSFPKLQI